MGMDVYGRNPTSETGQYFRNNVWWWRPLADYIIEHYSDEIPRIQKVSWGTNDGEGLGKRDSIKLAKLLRRDLDNGVIAACAEKYEKDREQAPKVACIYCTAGVRKNGAKCNNCEGTGKSLPWWTHYPFSVANMEEFERFLRDCGGFKIH